jgi:hypothetical protein
MLRHLLRDAGLDVLVEAESSAGMVAQVQQRRPACVFVASLAPCGLTQARYLCRRLRAQFPELRAVVGRWGHSRDPKKARKLLVAAGADRVFPRLREATVQLRKLSHQPITREYTLPDGERPA